ncbi:MAG TPA: YbjQ family protein, partial [Gammaproteobacteria bacterium]|nr:YbjQ family protein [Gammaproteobacteria bacterium]
CALVKGNVVISLDYFKRFIAGLRMLFGGRLVAYEPLLDRARREAILRMKAQAKTKGCDMIINFRMETSRLANDNQQRNNNTAGVEILVYGTAIKLAHSNDTIHP